MSISIPFSPILISAKPGFPKWFFHTIPRDVVTKDEIALIKKLTSVPGEQSPEKDGGICSVGVVFV